MRRHHFSFSLMVLGFLASGCASMVRGHVYFDQNGNQHKDDEEQGVAGATLTIKDETETLGTVDTDEEGYFEFRLKKPGKKYCVSGPGSLEACRDHQASGITNVDLAFAMDYQGAISKLQAATVHRKAMGDPPFTIELLYPLGCTLDAFMIPPALELIPSSSQTYNKSVGLFAKNLAENLMEEPAQAIGPSPVFGIEIASEEMTLKVMQETEEEISFTPTATCPDNATIALQQQSFQLQKNPLVRIEQSIVSGDLKRLGSEINIRVSTKNIGTVPLTQGRLTVKLPPFTSVNSPPQGCSTLGEKVTCDVTLLNPNIPKTIDFTFRLPETLNNDATFTLQTSFLSRELGEPVNAEDISFSIQGPPKKEG